MIMHKIVVQQLAASSLNGKREGHTANAGDDVAPRPDQVCFVAIMKLVFSG